MSTRNSRRCSAKEGVAYLESAGEAVVVEGGDAAPRAASPTNSSAAPPGTSSFSESLEDASFGASSSAASSRRRLASASARAASAASSARFARATRLPYCSQASARSSFSNCAAVRRAGASSGLNSLKSPTFCFVSITACAYACRSTRTGASGSKASASAASPLASAPSPSTDVLSADVLAASSAFTDPDLLVARPGVLLASGEVASASSPSTPHSVAFFVRSCT
mmetsp:Transcript_12513/g.52452  ORF Transcript_12513/g.52452 Transcript_12513/m.52452 type:complete len:225 (-) Transcript_12513:127-801(-)